MMTYDMGNVMAAIEESMGGNSNDPEKKEQGEIIDTTVVFAEVMETYKDSIATLPPEKRATMEAVKDMFVNMKVNENEGIMNISIGMEFNSIDELTNIHDKIEKVKSLDDKNRQVDNMTKAAPLGNLTAADDAKVTYVMTNNSFSRTTKVSTTDGGEENVEALFETTEDEDQAFMEYLEDAVFKIEYTFPKAIKSVSVEDAEVSEDRKTVTYKANWIEYLKNPLLLDVKVEFVDE